MQSCTTSLSSTSHWSKVSPHGLLGHSFSFAVTECSIACRDSVVFVLLWQGISHTFVGSAERLWHFDAVRRGSNVQDCYLSSTPCAFSHPAATSLHLDIRYLSGLARWLRVHNPTGKGTLLTRPIIGTICRHLEGVILDGQSLLWWIRKPLARELAPGSKMELRNLGRNTGGGGEAESNPMLPA